METIKWPSRVKEIKSVNIVAHERHNPRAPRVRPRSTEYELELILYYNGSQAADCTHRDGRLKFRKTALDSGDEPTYDEHDRRQPRNREDPIS